MRFRAESPVTAELCDDASRLAPTNPMLTWPYVQAMSATGYRASMIGLSDGDRWMAAAVVFLRVGKLQRTLELVSLPRLPEPEVFWSGLVHYCRRQGVSQLSIGTFSSPEALIPPLPGEKSRTKRSEFVIDLPGVDLMAQMKKTHRYCVRQGENAGLRLRRTRDSAHCVEHLQVNQASMERRAKRGEQVESAGDAFPRAALASGAAEMFQALRGDQVLSSSVVVRAPRGAYLHSSGSDPEGMKIGASPFLNFQIAKTLQTENCDIYNLGGANSQERGLWDYKTHFGTRRIDLEAVECDLGPRWRQKLSTLISFLRRPRDPVLRRP